MSSLAAVLGAFGERMGISGLAFDQQGCCRLVFDGRRLLELRAAGVQRRMVLSMKLGNVSSDLGRAQERALLQANFWNAGTGGGWFAFDERGQACLQQEVVITEDSDAQLLVKIEGLLNSAELWERKLTGGSVAGQSSAAPMFHLGQRV